MAGTIKLKCPECDDDLWNFKKNDQEKYSVVNCTNCGYHFEILWPLVEWFKKQCQWQQGDHAGQFKVALKYYNYYTNALRELKAY